MDRFKLINNTGNTYDVMPKGYNISKFGYSNTSKYSRVGNRYVNTLQYLAQQSPAFSVLFPQQTAEVDYLRFVMFLQDSPLRLMVEYDGFTFYQDVRIHSVEKNWRPVELIEATVTLSAVTPFYRVLKAFNEGGDADINGKTYNYTYNYKYADSVPMSAYVDVDGYIDSPVKLTIFGACVNPSWSYYRNSKLIATGKLNATIPENRKVVIDATTIPYSIKLMDLNNNVIGDMYGASDFSTERFIYFNSGRNRITVSQEETNDVSIGLEVDVYYASI